MGRRVLLGLLLASAVASGAELFNDKIAILDPFPREVARGKTLVIKGTCRGAFRTPELILIAPRGKTYLNGEQEIADQAFKFMVRFEEGVGTYRLELIAHTADSTRSAARFTIYYGIPKPEVEPPEPPPAGPRTPYAIHERLLEKRFFRLVNEFRKSIGCEPVLWNEAVAARAREHAQMMVEAQRRQHRFGKGGSIPDMLRSDGAGTSGLSGPPDPWQRIDSKRPFAPPTPGQPGPTVWNRLTVHVVQGDSLEVTFETHFVREAAFRICAADPHCLEVAIGAARPPTPPPVPGKPPPGAAAEVYYTVCFLQVNEKPLMRGQDEAFDALLRRGRAKDPDVLRALGCWSRPRAAKVLEDALDDPKPDVASAALDGLLLLDEDATRAEYAKRTAGFAEMVEQRRYGDAAALFAPFREVLYDKVIRRTHEDRSGDAQIAARRELGEIVRGPAEERAARAADLKKRSKGLGIDQMIDEALAKS